MRETRVRWVKITVIKKLIQFTIQAAIILLGFMVTVGITHSSVSASWIVKQTSAQLNTVTWALPNLRQWHWASLTDLNCLALSSWWKFPDHWMLKHSPVCFSTYCIEKMTLSSCALLLLYMLESSTKPMTRQYRSDSILNQWRNLKDVIKVQCVNCLCSIICSWMTLH